MFDPRREHLFWCWLRFGRGRNPNAGINGELNQDEFMKHIRMLLWRRGRRHSLFTDLKQKTVFNILSMIVPRKHSQKCLPKSTCLGNCDKTLYDQTNASMQTRSKPNQKLSFEAHRTYPCSQKKSCSTLFFDTLQKALLKNILG